MRKSIRILPTNVLAMIIIAVFAMVLFSRDTRIGFGFTHVVQDPAPSPPYVTLTPDNIDFGNQVVRRTSAAKRIIVKNTGGKPLYLDSVDIGGDNPNSFAITNDACTGATVDPNRSCTVDVTFTPSGTGDRKARLRLTDNALDSPQRVRLKGTGINSNDVAPF
jgi:hypothetical protein